MSLIVGVETTETRGQAGQAEVLRDEILDFVPPKLQLTVCLD